MKKPQRICPVCGHLEDANTDNCTECGAKTIGYEEASNDRKPVRTSASQPTRTSTDTPDTYPKQKKGKGGKAILPLVLIALILGGSVFAFLSKDGFDLSGANHSWLEANYQEPRICSECGKTKGKPLTPSFERHGLHPNMEEGITYDYVTACYKDSSLKTIGKLTVSDYRVFQSDATHKAKDGYEWHAFHVSILYDDKNARTYGKAPATSLDDYYDIEGLGGNLNYDSNDILRCKVNYYGIDYSECACSWEGKGWGNVNDNTSQWEKDLYALLPIGYDGLVIAFYDAALKGNGSYIYEIADENTLFFRMK